MAAAMFDLSPLVEEEAASAAFDQIPLDLLPTIISFIPLPHLQYRLVSKHWDHSMKIAHSLDQCRECIVRCARGEHLFSRMQQLTWRVDGQPKAVPWLLHWQLNIPSDFRTHHFNSVRTSLIPYLDSLESSCCYSILLHSEVGTHFYEYAAELADWCLAHSKPTRYNFFFSPDKIKFETPEQFSSFLRAPGMKHVTRLSLYQPQYKKLLAPLRDSPAVSNLKSLTMENVWFQAHDAGCLATSSYLTNLTKLHFRHLRGLDGMQGPDRAIGFDAIIRSSIMTNVQSFTFGIYEGYDVANCVVDAFAQSKHLKNLILLSLLDKVWSLEPLARCDATLPRLRTLQLQHWCELSTAAMADISSPTSALFNRIETLELCFSHIPIESMRILCASHGLKSLRALSLRSTRTTDEGLQLLASVTKDQFCHLQQLDVMWNSNLTNKSVVALYSAENLQSLRSINFKLSGKITTYVIQALIPLPPRPNLRALSFSAAGSERDLIQLEGDLKTAAPLLTIYYS